MSNIKENNKNNDELFFKVFRNVFLKNKVLDNSFFIFDNKTSNTNGNAFFEDKEEAKSNKFNLTNHGSNQIGSVFSNIKLPIESDLLIRFTFQISKPEGDNVGADGFAFVIQSISNKEHSYRYSGGSTLGYRDIQKGDGCVAVEFDTYQNEDEPNGNHISIQGTDTRGKALSSSHACSIASSVPSFSMKDGLQHEVEIKFNHKETSLTIIVDSVELLNNIHVPDLVGLKQAYFGFTAACGYFHSKHSIVSCEVSKQ
ncbi:hypothetical protein ACTA71_009598 [Dictyostelium dimigraforme]